MSEKVPVAKVTIDIYDNALPEIKIVGGPIRARMHQKALLLLRQEYYKHNMGLSRVKEAEYRSRKARNENILRKKHQDEHAKEQELNNDRCDKEAGTVGNTKGPGSAETFGKRSASGSKETGATETNRDN